MVLTKDRKVEDGYDQSIYLYDDSGSPIGLAIRQSSDAEGYLAIRESSAQALRRLIPAPFARLLLGKSALSFVTIRQNSSKIPSP